MGLTVADTICALTREHLERRNGLLFGQCLAAVGWVQHTVPPGCPGLVELPMCDVSGPGFAVGAALMGRRPIFVVRFQSFLWLAASPLVNYAAKSQDIWQRPCPILVRAIATEGNGSGPIHTNCYHALFVHMPGFRVWAPMTPLEVCTAWQDWLEHEDPVILSEHRSSYQRTDELADTSDPDADVTLYPVAAARFHMGEVVERLRWHGIRCNVVHVAQLKPFVLDTRIVDPLHRTRWGLVIDSGYTMAGVAQALAYTLMTTTGMHVEALGQRDRSPGCAPGLENGTPTATDIVQVVRRMLYTASPHWRLS